MQSIVSLKAVTVKYGSYKVVVENLEVDMLEGNGALVAHTYITQCDYCSSMTHFAPK